SSIASRGVPLSNGCQKTTSTGAAVQCAPIHNVTATASTVRKRRLRSTELVSLLCEVTGQNGFELYFDLNCTKTFGIRLQKPGHGIISGRRGRSVRRTPCPWKHRSAPCS